jgi:nucleoside-diphosphate-sugar epimerase
LDNSNKKIACVTGASGRIGRRLVDKLKKENFQVRVLKYRNDFKDGDLLVYHGDFRDKELIEDFLTGAQYLFHFAAELIDQSKMWDVNVNATKTLIKVAKSNRMKYFCFLSSAVVVGKTIKKEINEEIHCAPRNIYGKSKLEAERMLLSGITGCQIVVLRPVNVLDEINHGFLKALNLKILLNRFKLFIRGGECAHLVNTDDVVNAALYFIDKKFDQPECFFLAYDEDLYSTFAGLQLLYDSFGKTQLLDKTPKHISLPIIVPYLIKKILRKNSNMGDVKYSSKKILSHGFNYKVGLRETIRRYWESQH